MLLDPTFYGTLEQTVKLVASYPASPVFSAVPEAMLTQRLVSLTVAKRLQDALMELIPLNTGAIGDNGRIENPIFDPPRDFDIAGMVTLKNVVCFTAVTCIQTKEFGADGKAAIEELHITYHQAIKTDVSLKV